MKRPNLLPAICLFSIAALVFACAGKETPDKVAAENSPQAAGVNTHQQEQEIHSLIDRYAQARETSDTALLKSILTADIDQLVSSGEWRYGLEGAMKGMLQSSQQNPGDRTLAVEKIRFLNPESGVADARYEIQNADGTVRKMWSTFIFVREEDRWKIAAIRNMLPAGG